MASRMIHVCVMKRQGGIRMVSGWCRDGVRMASRMIHVRVMKLQGGIRMVSGWGQDEVSKAAGKCQGGDTMTSGNVRIVHLRQERVSIASGWRRDGVREAAEVCQGRSVGVRSLSGCVRMR